MEASAIPAPAVRRPATPAVGRFLRLRSDEQLVALFRGGDEAAFQAIHDRYRQRLFAYARQMLGGSRQDAEDALQDVFLRAYGALRADSRPVSLRAWLYRVAHNRCIDHLRRPIPPAAEVFELSRRPLHDPIEEAERREDLRRLVEDVQNLPSQQRSALLMREMDGLSYAELADALDVTIPAVKSLLVRARIGLVEAGEARDTACVEIRESLALSHGRGVRATGLARRHMRECRDCREYRTQLKAVQGRMAALSPSPAFGPFAGLAQVLGLGGAGTSAAAGGGVAVISGTAATKMAVVVCAVAVTAGGATEVRHHIQQTAPADAAAAAVRATAPASGGAVAVPASGVHVVEALALPAVEKLAVVADRAKSSTSSSPDDAKLEKVPAADPADDEAISPHAAPDGPYAVAIEPSGGAAAPAEDTSTSTGTSGANAAPAASPSVAVTPDEPPVVVAEPTPPADPAASAPDLDEPTVEGTTGGARAPSR